MKPLIGTSKASISNFKKRFCVFKCYYVHQIGMSQLASSGTPVGCIVLNGKQYEPDSLEPLLQDVVEKHPDLNNIDKVNADGIFNSQPCRDTIREILGENVELFSSVNPRNKKDIVEKHEVEV